MLEDTNSLDGAQLVIILFIMFKMAVDLFGNLTISAPYLYENAIHKAKFVFGKTQIMGEKYAKKPLNSVKYAKKTTNKQTKNCFSGKKDTHLP